MIVKVQRALISGTPVTEAPILVYNEDKSFIADIEVKGPMHLILSKLLEDSFKEFFEIENFRYTEDGMPFFNVIKKIEGQEW
jgi:hypothetical protein